MGREIFKNIFLLLALTCGLVQASEPLDQQRVHKAYEEGDFDVVIGQLTAFQKANPLYSRTDSIFIAKHLAVVYAANPQTVEIGKHWMYRLLDLLPAADFVGMYVNEEIDRIFDKVRVEFLARQHGFGVDTAQIVLPTRQEKTRSDSSQGASHASRIATTPQPASATSSRSWRKWAWVGAGGATIAAAIVTFFLVTDEDPSTSTSTVPVTL